MVLWADIHIWLGVGGFIHNCIDLQAEMSLQDMIPLLADPTSMEVHCMRQYRGVW